jgi:hypothetical protein
VRRVVQVSALGVSASADTAFARTKFAGDAALMAQDLDWVVLRPSVVVGRAAYGGSALFRGLAALPIIPRLEGAGLLQVVQLDDLVRTIVFCVSPQAPSRVVLDVVGPERLTLEDVLAAYRRWLGLGPARFLSLPSWMAGLAFRGGDVVGLLGWRPPLRTTVARELARGATGDPAVWSRTTGIAPQSLDAALASEPASVQERWFARLYFAKPLIIGVLSLFWIVTGLVTLGPGWESGVGLIRQAGFSPAGALAVMGALADIAIGIGIAVRRTARPALFAALALSTAYLALGAVYLPSLWGDPLGPLVKVLPIMVLHVTALAILVDR